MSTKQYHNTGSITGNKYILFFDGCSKGNPGPSGAGAVLCKNKKEILTISTFVGNFETNNSAEYMGLIEGLKEAQKLNIKTLIVKGDSQLVIRQMLGLYKVNSERLKPLFFKAKELENNFKTVKYQHIPRSKNQTADALANSALFLRK